MTIIPEMADAKLARKKKAAQDWIVGKFPNLACPACAQKGHTVKDFVLLPVPNILGSWEPSETKMPAVVVACNNCPYLWVFSTEPMNLP
jgi:hypothetical protein